MRILVLSFYYQPDLCAGSFRTTPLVNSLLAQISPDTTIDVITTLPNRYHSFTINAPEWESRGNASITRIVLPTHRSGMVDQSKAFLAFARGALRAADAPYDVVFATSSRLMTAVLGAWIAKRKKARLYLDIRDIFVDTIKDVASGPVAWLTRPFFSLLERWVVLRARKVNLVSQGFAEYFEARYPGKRFTYFTNGIDDEFLDESALSSAASQNIDDRPLTVLYAGNLGEGQGMHAIVPDLALRMGPRIRFQIVGDGGRKRALETALAMRAVTNVELRPPVARTELLKLYRSADVLLLHLNDYDAFKKVLPSKIFEYAAMGKPIWAGVAGHAAEFVRAEVRNAAVFRPCDVEEAVTAFANLDLTYTPRAEFLTKYSRARISRAMAADILSLAPKVS